MKTTALTLLWLILPVHKVDDVSILQHVRLLLDQFGHVDHSAVGATGPQKKTTVCIYQCVVSDQTLKDGGQSETS